MHDDESHVRHVRPDVVVVGAVKNSTTAGARTPGFTLCVCPANSRYRAPGTAFTIVCAASRSLGSVLAPFITSTGTRIEPSGAEALDIKTIVEISEEVTSQLRHSGQPSVKCQVCHVAHGS